MHFLLRFKTRQTVSPDNSEAVGSPNAEVCSKQNTNVKGKDQRIISRERK